MTAMIPYADLPLITLQNGRWKAEIYDPRANPLALGARYVHGAYIAALFRDDRCLTDSPIDHWHPYFGGGIPDVFEWPLGFQSAEIGQSYLRIGAGRLVRQNQFPTSDADLEAPVHWHVDEQSKQHLIMSCVDRLKHDQHMYGYHLKKKVMICEDGLRIQNTLTLDTEWNHPLAWFAHPFFAHSHGMATGFEIPEGSQPGAPLKMDEHGLLRLPEDGGLGNVTGLWGNTGSVVVHLDPRLGGGLMAVSLDRPLDHLVLYASERVASPEPQLARSWKNGESANWTHRYQWIDL